MNKILLFAGTTEGRELSERLCRNRIGHFVSVATDYGKQLLKEDKGAVILKGRMDKSTIESFIEESKIETVVDATHPYAKEAALNIKEAAENKGVEYLRLDRKKGECRRGCKGSRIYSFGTTEECIEALKKTKGEILLTTGSKELDKFCSADELKDRLTVRVLPGIESIRACEENSIAGSRIVAMQGPFSVEMNRAIIKNYGIEIVVTKDGGKTGGFPEKAEAAEAENAALYLIGRPENREGMSFEEVYERLISKYKEKIRVDLIGCGMGSRETMTLGALEAIEGAEIIFGAERLLKSLEIKKESYPYYLAKDILPVLKQRKRDAAVLLSGDSGFYSAAAFVKRSLEEESSVENEFEIRLHPGISSLSYLAAKSGISWGDAFIISLHGKAFDSQKERFLRLAVSKKKLFVLFSGSKDLKAAGRILEEAGIKCRLIIGYALSSDEEKIYDIEPKECGCIDREGLFCAFVINEEPLLPYAGAGIRDADFIRDKVPMTKEEIRHVSISKLRLRQDSILYDVGCGTGSVSVEAASLCDGIRVYAIEKKAEALRLTEKNIEKFGLGNIELVKGEAPEALESLPAPSHVFIGGSSGKIRTIVKNVLEKNPSARIVANAVSFETLRELLDLEKEFAADEFEIVSLQAVRRRKLGEHNMLQGENPVWICSFKGKKNE